MYRITNLALASILSVMVFTALPAISAAQTQPEDRISLEMEQVDVREAIRALFKSTKVSYSIAPDVQGLITVNLKNVPFETALLNITRQVDSTFRIVGGVYEIVKKEQDIQVPPDSTTPINTKTQRERRRVYVRSSDPQFLAALIGGTGTNFTLTPEMSTVKNGGNGGFGNSGFGGGGSNNGSFGPGGFNGFNGGNQSGNRTGNNAGNGNSRGGRGG